MRYSLGDCLFMTVGSACALSEASGSHHPLVPVRASPTLARQTLARKTERCNSKCVKTWLTSRTLPAAGRDERQSEVSRRARRPVRAGHFCHAAEEARFGALAKIDRLEGVDGDEAAPRRSGFSFLAALRGNVSGSAVSGPGNPRERDRGHRQAVSACRSSRRDPSSPARNRPGDRPGSARGRGPAFRGLAAAAASRRHGGARSRRSTFPSRTALARLKAIAAMAAAV